MNANFRIGNGDVDEEIHRIKYYTGTREYRAYFDFVYAKQAQEGAGREGFTEPANLGKRIDWT